MLELIYKYEAVIRLAVFLGGFTLLALWEWAYPRRELTQAKSKRWLNNIALVVCNTIVLRILLPIAAVGVAYLVEQEHWGFANHLEVPFWAKVLISFILLDISIYFQHVIFHVIPIMWRFHRVHHSDLDCDVTTGLRFHPVEIVVSILIKFVVIISLGAPVLAVILFEVVLNLMSMFSHSNIRLNAKFERLLRWLLVTPDMHRVHHSVSENETNSNFGFNISLWDRIFATYMAAPAAGHQGMTIGLDQFREPKWQAFNSLLIMPFESSMRGYAINFRDTINADELNLARELAHQNEEKARLASELASYIKAIGQHALVSTADIDGRIIQVNDKFCEVSGYSRDELLGKNHRIINSGTHPRAFFAGMWATITNGNTWHDVVCNKAKNGSLYWVESSIVPVMGDDGRPEHFISVRFDITARNRAEHDLSILNEALESKVEERTRELSFAMEDAEAANKAKSIFLRNMSHEFRTPLHSIMSFSSIGIKKLDSIPKEMLKQYLTDIKDSGNNLLNLVNDLLDLSKLEADSTSYDYQLIDIEEVISRCVCEQSTLADEKHIEFKTCSPEEPVIAVMDRDKIAQVIRNLISNALKFAPEKGLVEIMVSRDSTGHVRVTVRDQGPGIPHDEVDSIFDAFVQSSITQSNAGGTGLGLPICKEIIERGHNGHIFVESDVNTGSCFIFTIGEVGQADMASSVATL